MTEELKGKQRFVQICRLDNRHGDGHRLFFDRLNPRLIAIADNSGDYPDQCDDGALYVNVNKIEASGFIEVDKDNRAMIPLLVPSDDKMEHSRTMIDLSGALHLRAVLHLTAQVVTKVNGLRYTFVKVEGSACA